jgi:hypothetical protein
MLFAVEAWNMLALTSMFGCGIGCDMACTAIGYINCVVLLSRLLLSAYSSGH